MDTVHVLSGGASLGGENGREVLLVGDRIFTIRSTSASSARYGVCEVCKEHVTDVHHQVERSADGRRHVADWFGHRVCLLAARDAARAA